MTGGKKRVPGLIAVLGLMLGSAPGRPASAREGVVINELLAVNHFTNTDEDGDSSDWVELFNPGESPFDLGGYGLSDDRLDPFRWVFPDVTLQPGDYLLVWCSGKDRITPLAERVIQRDSPIPFVPSLVDLDSEWRYLIGAPDEIGPSPLWKTEGYDDSFWQVGKPGFGFGDDDDTTVLPEDIGAAFFRLEFELDADTLEAMTNLILQLRYDDGFVAYLNGEEVASAGFDSSLGEPQFASLANRSHEGRSIDRFELTDSLDLLRPGENLLAMVLLNRSVGNSDLTLAPELGHVLPVYHTNFRLEAEGEDLALSRPDGDIEDIVSFGVQTEDRSYGRVAEAGGAFRYLLGPTPLEPNGTPYSLDPISSRPDFSPPGGEFSGPVGLEISATLPLDGIEIRYTTDGREPTAASTLYAGPIEITRSTVVRAAAFAKGIRLTEVDTHSYLLNVEEYDLPILSIGMAPEDFNDVHLRDGARGPSSERPGHVEIVNVDGERVGATGMGLRLHGGAGRGGGLDIKKAYRMYFRREYGEPRLRYPLMPDTEVEDFDKLVLRSNFNDAFRTGPQATLIRDELVRLLHADMGAPISHGAWYNLFVNTRYLGVYNVVERMDKVFLASYFPEYGENWDVIKTGEDALDGDRVAWNSMLGFFRTENLADDAIYARAFESIDVENYTAYMILNIWAQNHDWPHNNWYAARPRVEGGRWIFLSWDAEFGIGRQPTGFTTDTLNHVFSRAGTPIADILRGLFKNRGYQKYFLDEARRDMEGPLAPENVLAHIDRLAGIIAPDIPEESRVTPGSVGQWENNIRTLETFARNRNRSLTGILLNSPRFTFPRVLSVSPRRLRPLDRVVTVQLGGQRFSPGTEVLFNDVPSPSVVYISTQSLEAVLPGDPRVAGSPAVTVQEPGQSGAGYTTPDLLEVEFPRPRFSQIVPATGVESGGESVFVIGEDFGEGVRIEFGGIPSPSVRIVDDSNRVLDVLTPPGSGVVDIRVVNTLAGELVADELGTFRYVPGPSFRRGDVTADGLIDGSDVVAVLLYLFGRADVPGCVKSADADDNGKVNIADATELLRHLFAGIGPLSPPFQACGSDPTPDRLDCETSPGCLDPGQ